MPGAIMVRRTGGPEVLTWEGVEVGPPQPGQVRLAQAAAGLNFIDVYHRMGLYPQPLPFIPGVNVNQRYPLKEAAQAHADLESRATTGSTVLLA
jgi:NADPH:quinone reductase-like Zn-dependent oxidoreductase